MTIHHSQQKKAEKAGYTLTEGDEGVVAFWPRRGLAIHGASSADAMAQMQAAQVIMTGDAYRIAVDADQPRLVSVYDAEMRLKGSPMPPVAAHRLIFLDRTAEWSDEGGENDRVELFPDLEQPTVTAERINGIAIDGAVAYKEGTPSGDCPYSSETEIGNDSEAPGSEYDNFLRWNEEWDAAADEATDEEDKGGGSVVSSKYRAKYAEAGHPTHCGDWLAETLNEIVLNKEGVNLELFEAICGLNGVDTSKYKRSGVGWQGRIRMTGRNLISKRVFLNEGKLILPEALGLFKQAPPEWMALQRFKAAAK